MANFTWLDWDMEHSPSDEARATVLAKRITSLLDGQEQRAFRRLADFEDGQGYDPYEDCECDACLAAEESGCLNCEARIEDQRKLEVAAIERELDLEMLQEKLAMLGARMMRSYEHWNEDEHIMQYEETKYDY